MDATGLRDQGNQADFILGTPEGWNAFGVVRWHGVEEISQPYRYDITLQRSAADGPVDLDNLLDAGATFRIASHGKWRVVHGILAEAEEIDRNTQIILYRVLLVPHFWRARYRRRCRNFLKKTLVEIISAVLENRSPDHPEGLGGLTRFSSAQAPDLHPSFDSFTPPTASYRWDVKDPSRIENTRTRPYVVQYNESDFDFVSRLLEEEGLSYTFAHGRSEVILSITDQPGVSPLFDEDTTFTLRRQSTTGRSQQHEIVRSFRDARRLRSRAVTVRDWDYNRSAAPLEARVEEPSTDPDLSRHFEFPAGEEAVEKDPGMHTATVRKQRYDVERALREGMSNVRTMEPGRRFTLHDGDGIIQDAKLLAVRVETFATELAPQGTVLDEEPFGFANAIGPLSPGFDSRFAALPEGVQFRPAMRTPKPRIHGVQAAVVTAEEYPEGDRPAINGDSAGRVRVRFPWDQRPDTGDKTPTSRWIRVSQFWAGAGYGALYTPRVGHEVLVAYMQGDPDQPVIVGRVYNAQHVPPYDARKEPTKSTVKSQSAEEKKEVEGFNELRFDDRAKQEEIYLHAQRNLNEVVLASHSTSVGGDQSNSVGGNQTNSVKGHREHSVGDYETVSVGSDRTTNFHANEHHNVSGERDTKIGANDNLNVGGWHNVKVSAGDTLEVGGKRDVTVKADYNIKTSANYTSVAGVTMKGEAAIILVNGKVVTSVHGGVSLYLHGGTGVHITAGSTIDVTAPSVNVEGSGEVNVKGGVVHINGGTVNLNC